MSQILSKSILKRLFKNIQNPIKSELHSSINEDAFLVFLLSLILPDFSSVDSFFNFLDNRICEYIIYKTFKITIKCINLEYNKNFAQDLLEFCLMIEARYKKIALIAPEYFERLIMDADVQFLNKILFNRTKITKIVKLIITFRNDVQLSGILYDYHVFTNSKIKPYGERFQFLTMNLLNIEKLYKYASKHDETLLSEIISLYPEFYSPKPVFLKERLSYFLDPSILETYKTIRCFSMAQPYFISLFISSKVDKNYIKNMHILYKLIIIEKHIVNDTQIFCKKILQPFIIETPDIVELMVKRKFEIGLIEDIVNNTPSFFVAFDLCVALFMQNRDSFYQILIKKLVIKYPTFQNVRKILLNKEFFNGDFFIGLEKIIEDYNKEVINQQNIV